MRVLICGSRNFTNYAFLCSKCDHYLQRVTNPTIISGCAKGADTLAIQYAQENSFSVIKIPANWEKHGRSAGFKRNYHLVQQADAVIAFSVDNSRGTEHTISLAKKKGIPVRVIRLVSKK